MKLLIATLAESANISPNGRLHIRGVVDTMVASRGFPYTPPPLTLVLRFELDPKDRDKEHAIRMDVLDGQEKVISIPWTYRAPGMGARQPLVDTEILPFQLEEPVTKSGRLSFDVFWDDQKRESLSVEIVDGGA